MMSLPGFDAVLREFSTAAAGFLPSAAIVFGAGVLRGFTGFGFALAAVPLLGLVRPPAEAVPVAISLQFLGGLFDLRAAARQGHWPSLRWLMTGAVLGSPLGMLLLGHMSPALARTLIGSITLSAVVVLAGVRDTWGATGRGATAAAGFIAGLFNGLAGMPGPPAVAYYVAQPLHADTIRASLLIFFLATSAAALASAAPFGLLDLAVVARAALLLPLMIAGGALGGLAYGKGSAALHRRTSMALLAAIGLLSAARGLAEMMQPR
jgi:uncharacterized membrane protein YfcA